MIGVSALAAYFGIVLVPEWRPGFAETTAFFLYLLSIPVTLLVLLGLALWGAAGTFVFRRRDAPVSRRQRALLVLPLAGFLLFGSAIALAQSIRRGLPTGSHLLDFEAAVWQDPSSLTIVEGDITPRQKMLGSVVERLLPGRSRSEIETLLGPSLATPYFAATGRDMIYVLGLERDSFINIDSEWLLIWLDGSGRFKRYEIVTD